MGILAEAQQHSDSLLHGHFIHRALRQQLLNQAQPLLLNIPLIVEACTVAAVSNYF